MIVNNEEQNIRSTTLPRRISSKSGLTTNQRTPGDYRKKRPEDQKSPKRREKKGAVNCMHKSLYNQERTLARNFPVKNRLALSSHPA